MSQAQKRSVDVDDYPIKTVDGVAVRVVPLVERGPDRRVANVPLSAGSPVTVTLTGVYGADGTVEIDGLPMGPTITVFRGEQAVLAVPASAVVRVERRSGKDRRK